MSPCGEDMREESTHDRLLVKMRTQFWNTLPTKAYRVRQLIRKQRGPGLDPGELEELELTVKRIADSAASLGFTDVGDVGARLASLLWQQRSGVEIVECMDQHCDRLDQIIDEMTLEAMAVGLRSLWHD